MILIPYGKYPVSQEALKYALAATNPFRKLPIICFRATESNLSVDKLANLEDEILQEVKGIASDYPDIEVSVEVRNGKYDEAIDQYVQAHPIRIIIAGIRKANGLQKVIFEGKASKFLTKIKTPIVLIPEGYQYHPIKTILFASDFKPIKSDDALDPLVDIAQVNEAEVRIAHVRTDKRHLNEEEVMEMHRESSLFGDEIKHSFKHIFRSSISKGIDYYLKLKGDNDLLVLIKREKGFMGRQFGKDNAIDFALHPTLPVLILHEEGQ